jgi:hypothetical protein
MKIFFALIIALVIFNPAIVAQEMEHRWKPLSVDDNEKIWYDAATLDTASGSRFDVWILQMHRPPLKFDGIKGDVFRSKILYAVDLEKVKYGMLKVVYYDLENKEIFKYNYDIVNVMDEIKYTYPVMQDSYLHRIIKEFAKLNGVR